MGSLGETSRPPHPRAVFSPPQTSSPESDSLSSLSPRDSQLPYEPISSSSPVVVAEVESPSMGRRRLGSGHGIHHQPAIANSPSETDSSCPQQQQQQQQQRQKLQELLSPIESPRDIQLHESSERETSALDFHFFRPENEDGEGGFKSLPADFLRPPFPDPQRESRSNSGGSGVSLPSVSSEARCILEEFLRKRSLSLHERRADYISSTPSDDEKPLSPSPGLSPPPLGTLSSSGSASSNKSPEASSSLDPPKKISVQFRELRNETAEEEEGAPGEEEVGGDSDKPATNGAKKNGVAVVGNEATGSETEKEERHADASLPAFHRRRSPPSSENHGCNTFPDARRSRHNSRSSVGPAHLRQEPQTAETLPRALRAWTFSVPSGGDDWSTEGEKRRSRKPTHHLFQIFNAKEQRNKRVRSTDRRPDSKSDSEARRLDLHRRGNGDAVVLVDEDRHSQESEVKKKKSKKEKGKFRKRVERMVSLNKDKDSKKLSRKSSGISEESDGKRKLQRQKLNIDAELGDLTKENLFSEAAERTFTPEVIGHISIADPEHEVGKSTTTTTRTTTTTTTTISTRTTTGTDGLRRSDPLRDSKGRRISRERIDARWAKKGAVVRADIRTEDDPGTLAGESSTSDEDDAPGAGVVSAVAGGNKFKKFNLLKGLNIFGRNKKKKTKKKQEGIDRLQSCGAAIDVTPIAGTSSAGADEDARAPLALPEDTDTPEHRADGRSKPAGNLATSLSDSQIMIVDFGANLAIDTVGAAASPPQPQPSSETKSPTSTTRPIDINRPDDHPIQPMDHNENSVPFDQATEEERRARIAKVVEKLESLAAKISNAQTPVGEGCSVEDGDALSSSSAFSSYNPISLFNSIRGMFPSTDSASSTTASNLAHLADLPRDPLSLSPEDVDVAVDGAGDSPELAPMIFRVEEEKEDEDEWRKNQEGISPESGVDVVSPSEDALPSVGESTPLLSVAANTPPRVVEPTTSPTSEPAPARARRPSVPMTLNLDLNVPADRERLYQPILRELLRPASEFTHFSRIASTVLRPHNHAGQLAKFFEITSNAILMTGSSRDQERLKEWAMRYFEENLAPFIVEEGWDGILDEVEEEEEREKREKAGAETETSRDSELD